MKSNPVNIELKNKMITLEVWTAMQLCDGRSAVVVFDLLFLTFKLFPFIIWMEMESFYIYLYKSSYLRGLPGGLDVNKFFQMEKPSQQGRWNWSFPTQKASILVFFPPNPNQNGWKWWIKMILLMAAIEITILKRFRRSTRDI